MASSWLTFFERKKTTKKKHSNKLSQLRHVELANVIICIGRDDDGTPSWLKGM